MAVHQNRGSRSSFARTTLHHAARRSLRRPGGPSLFTDLRRHPVLPSPYEQAQEAQDERLEEVVGMLARTKAAFSRQPPSFQAFFMDDDVFERQWLLDEDDPQSRTARRLRRHHQTLHKTAERCMHAFGIFCPTAITP